MSIISELFFFTETPRINSVVYEFFIFVNNLQGYVSVCMYFLGRYSITSCSAGKLRLSKPSALFSKSVVMGLI